MLARGVNLVLTFALPTITEKDRKTYTYFRKYLIRNGYIMIQYSVYGKIFNNRDAARNHIKTLYKNIPLKGYIRIMLVTEKQYNKSIIIIGGKSNQEEILTVNPFVII